MAIEYFFSLLPFTEFFSATLVICSNKKKENGKRKFLEVFIFLKKKVTEKFRIILNNNNKVLPPTNYPPPDGNDYVFINMNKRFNLISNQSNKENRNLIKMK